MKRLGELPWKETKNSSEQTTRRLEHETNAVIEKHDNFFVEFSLFQFIFCNSF